MPVEELLIYFRELVGEHSGENLAHAVYDTLSLYGLKDRVSCQIILGLCTLMLITCRSSPSMQITHRTMTQWSNSWRPCCAQISLNLMRQMPGCGACLIRFICQHWRYLKSALVRRNCKLIQFIWLAFENNRCGQR